LPYTKTYVGIRFRLISCTYNSPPFIPESFSPSSCGISVVQKKKSFVNDISLVPLVKRHERRCGLLTKSRLVNSYTAGANCPPPPNCWRKARTVKTTLENALLNLSIKYCRHNASYVFETGNHFGPFLGHSGQTRP
jgi:hypothetical protein